MKAGPFCLVRWQHDFYVTVVKSCVAISATARPSPVRAESTRCYCARMRLGGRARGVGGWVGGGARACGHTCGRLTLDPRLGLGSDCRCRRHGRRLLPVVCVRLVAIPQCVSGAVEGCGRGAGLECALLAHGCRCGAPSQASAAGP